MIIISLLQGGSVLLLLTVLFGIFVQNGMGEDKARAITFIALVASNISLIWTNRSWSQSIIRRSREANNKAIVLITCLALAVIILINYIPVLTILFKFNSLTLLELVLAIIGGFAMVIWFEILKLLKIVNG
jgi:Ca2+-transporting ATPase